MSKNIIFLADGTWNGPGEEELDDKNAAFTNVFKTFLNLDGMDSPDSARLSNEQERTLQISGTLVQIAKYLHGVGDSDNFLVKSLGGTLGAGLIARVVRGYTFVSRNYAPGDKIFLIGFSRGAYTARSLAGLIAAKGLLDASKLDLADKENAYRIGSAVWYEYREAALRATHGNWLGRLAQMILDLPRFVSSPPANIPLVAAEIECVAVWDTVGALGIPEYNLKTDKRIDAFQFCDTKLSPKVRNGIHCMSVDEQRGDFLPTLWDGRTGILQALFPGAHADVGGGYPCGNESGLSDDAYMWVAENLAKLDVRYRSTPIVTIAPDPKGIAHQPWTHIPWTVLPRTVREFPAGLALRRSVLDRINAGLVLAEPGSTPAKYNPANLTAYIAGQKAVSGVVVV
ncbi:MAG TPA: DUF2235 domain-containing protein [Xanthobacteraceae bacterium]